MKIVLLHGYTVQHSTAHVHVQYAYGSAISLLHLSIFPSVGYMSMYPDRKNSIIYGGEGSLGFRRRRGEVVKGGDEEEEEEQAK